MCKLYIIHTIYSRQCPMGKERSIIILISIWETKEFNNLFMSEWKGFTNSLNGKTITKFRGTYQERQDERQTKRLGGQGMLRSQEQPIKQNWVAGYWPSGRLPSSGSSPHSQFCPGRGMSQQLLPESTSAAKELLSALSPKLIWARWTAVNQQQKWRAGRATAPVLNL